MRINIAVTSAGSAPAVSVIKSLRKQRQIKFHITALDMDVLSSGFYLSDRKAVIPSSDSPGFIDKIIKICKSYSIQCLIPIIDEELFVFAANRERFERLGIKLIVNNKETIKLARDKYKTQQFCERNKISVPKTFHHRNVDGIKDLNYPFIIKPIDGRGSKDIVKIKNKNDFNFFKSYFKNFIIQEFIEGQEYTIDIVASSAGEIMQAVPRQRISVRAGVSYKGKIEKNQTLMNYGRHIANVFNINGPANIQCIVKKNDIYLIEVNPKFAAGLPLTVASGVNIPLILVKLAFGLKVTEKELQFRDGMYMLRFWDEVFVAKI